MNNFDQWSKWSAQAKQVLGEDFWNDIMSSLGNLNQLTNASPWGGGRSGFNVRADLYETSRDLIAVLELPGLESAEGIDVQVEGDQLLVSGVFEKAYENEQVLVSERVSGRFERTIPLPHPVRREGTVARYRNGILEIRMPKSGADRGSKQRVRVDY